MSVYLTPRLLKAHIFWYWYGVVSCPVPMWYGVGFNLCSSASGLVVRTIMDAFTHPQSCCGVHTVACKHRNCETTRQHSPSAQRHQTFHAIKIAHDLT